MKVHRIKLTALNKSILLTVVLIVIITISVLKNNTINNINNFVNVFELYVTKPDKKITENIVQESSKDQKLVGNSIDNGFLEEQDSKKLINFTDISNLKPQGSSRITQNAANGTLATPKLLIMILSGPDEKHEIRRQCVRSSYLSIEPWRRDYKHFFLIGQTVNETLERNITKEEQLFRDIVRYPEPDSYGKLSTKVMWGFQYILEVWNLSFNLILKTDDDSFVNVENIMQTFQSVDLGHDFYGGGKRFPGKKANVKKRQQFKHLYSKDFQVPDHFCAGGGYFLTRSLMKQILSLHSEPPPAQVEDIYVGSLVEKLGIEPTKLNVQTNHGWQASWNLYNREGLVLHYLNCKKLMRLYNQVKPG